MAVMVQGDEAWRMLWQHCCAAHQAGRLAEAEEGYRRLLQISPQHGDALHQLAILLVQSQRMDEALPLFQAAAAQLPKRADVWNNLAEAARRGGEVDAAIAACRTAIGLAPQFAEAHYNLGCALRDAGESDEAVAAYRRAIALRPQYARAHHNLANLLRREGKTPVAVEHFRQAIAAQPKWWEPQFNLAVAHLELGETAPALEWLGRVQPLVPSDAEADIDAVLGDLFVKQGRIEEARPHYAKSLARDPKRGLSRLRHELLAPPIPPSIEAIEGLRTKARETLSRHRLAPLPWEAADLSGSSAEPPMAWAYHGQDERPLKEAYAALFLPRIEPVKLSPRPARRRPHVGFVVTSGHEGVFDRCLGGLAQRLHERGRLEVSWVSTRAGLNVLRFLRPAFSGGGVRIPERVDEAASVLAASDIDLLYYWEVGTDSLNYFLPFYRPTPLQLAGWGWPVTAGHDRIDGFVSSELLEPPDGESHYTERLIKLPVLPTWYERPPAPSVIVPRDRFGFTSGERILVCAQNLRKLTPVFDPLLAELLRQDGGAALVLVADEQPTISEQFKKRLAGAATDVIARVRIMPRLPREEYLKLLSVADVVLDPFGYGGGANTVLDAAAVGVPVVTCPGPFHRGRWQGAVNQLLAVPELNASSLEEYASVCRRVSSDAGFRQDLQRRIRDRASSLFENEEAVDAHERCFLEHIANRRGS